MQSIEQFTARLLSDPPHGSRVRSHLTLPSAALTLGPACSVSLPPRLCSILHAQGTQRLAEYQWQALRSLQQGQHVCLSVPTGGGRGVTRLLALYQSLGAGGNGHALCIYPQKHRELAQLKTLTAWNDHLQPEHRLTAAIYDGDTPKTQRRAIKQSPPHLVLTTPEMLHAGILAYHGGWRAFFQNLRVVVLVDLHLCTGALSTHLAHLWRRLHRLCRHYGAHPQYLITSAPLANIGEMAHTLTGQPCTVVSGEIRRLQSQTRVMLEALSDTTSITHELVTRLSEVNMQSLVFESGSADMHDVSYSTLPRGVIFPGLPSSLTRLHEYLALLASSFAPSVSLLILRGHTPLECYLLHYPAVYQAPWPQALPLNPSNPQVAGQHLLCAASELALEAGEQYAGLHGLRDLMHQLASDQVITRRAASHQWIATQRQPHRRVRLRSYEPAFAVIHQYDGRLITTLDPEQAFREAFEGAVYYHTGQPFHVERHLADRRRIMVRPTDAAYRTRSLVRARVTDMSLAASRVTETYRISYGTLNYTETLYAFERLDAHTQARRSLQAIANCQRQFRTQGVWIDFPVATDKAWQTAVHTLVHAVLAGLPLLLICEGTRLVGGIFDQDEPGVAGRAAVFVDTQTGGNGVSASLFRAYKHVLRAGLQILLHCNCAQGCSRCGAGQRCDTCGDTVELDRQAGMRLLQKMLGEVVPPLETVRF
jgi:DEAD/DEAH box helicase domain-containing protein